MNLIHPSKNKQLKIFKVTLTSPCDEVRGSQSVESRHGLFREELALESWGGWDLGGQATMVRVYSHYHCYGFLPNEIPTLCFAIISL
jgi:hypothetical protein